MIRELKQHPIAYTALSFLLISGVMSFLAAWPNHDLQRMVAVGIGGTYFFWGILTHVKADHLTRRIASEYLAISALTSLLLVLVTF